MGFMKSPKQPMSGASAQDRVFDEADRMFDNFWSPRHGSDEGKWNGVFSVNVEETKDALTLKAELPGLNREDVKITCEGNVLTISGEKKTEKASGDKKTHRVESSFGSFRRSFTLPSGFKPEDVKPVFKDGVLTVTVRKAQGKPSKEVRVKAE
jgi:HSP20 family protein